VYVLLCYDVNTLTPEGRKRLRKVAGACEDYGQRVQFSVFECRVTDMELEQLRAKLLDLIDEKEDSLRIYHLPGDRAQCVDVYGLDKYEDLDEPLFV
jgi:CRISPR-associated protein Cas2